MPPKLSLPPGEGVFFLFQNYPLGEGNCETIERQKFGVPKTVLLVNRALHHQNKGFAARTPWNEENDENGGYRAGKGMVYEKHRSWTPKNCLAAIFAPRHQDVSSGPLGVCVCQRKPNGTRLMVHAGNCLGQKSCRTKAPRIFRFFSPNFSPNFTPNFPRFCWGFFVLHFVGNGDQKKFTKNPRQANTKKIIHKIFLESRHSKIADRLLLFFWEEPSMDQC